MMVTQPAPHAPYLFVSYASADHARVEPLVVALTRAGVPVWMDRHDIAGGENYALEIVEGIKGCAALVLMCSAASLASRNVKQEVGLAWKHERPYLPLLLEPVTIPDDLSYFLEMAQWIEVLDKPEGEWLPQVLAALEPLGIAPAAPVQEEMRLAGRERELALLWEKLAAAKEGKGGLVLIGGEAGVGKTTLAEAAMRSAERQGCVVLEGHCFDLAETPPYGPWIDLFLRLPALPGLPTLPPAFAARRTVCAVASQMALFSQVQDFLVALARQQPVVLLIDDLHWSDPASLDLLRFLARLVANTPLLVLVTYRSDELTRRHPLYQLLPQLARDPSAARLDLRTLDEAAVRTLVQERYGLPEPAGARLSGYVQARAEGNALFVGELLRSLEEAGVLRQEGGAWAVGELSAAAIPTLLRQVIDGRLARLDEESQRLLAVAAVVGHEIPYTVWAKAAEVDEEHVLDCMERAEEAGVVGELPHGEGARFAHALIREALYEGLASVRRRRLHRRVGEALAEQSAPDPDAVASHFHRAGDPRALAWLIQAGERAQRAYARLTAADRFEAALALMETQETDAGERGWLLLRLGLLRRYDDRRKALAYLESAVQVAGEGDALLAASARCNQGLVLCYGSDLKRGIAAMEEAIAAFDALPSIDERVRRRVEAMGIATDVRHHRGLLTLWLSNIGDFRRALPLAEQVAQRMPETAVPTLDGAFAPDVYRALGYAYAIRGQPAAARAAWVQSRAAYEAIGDLSQLSGSTFGDLWYVVLPYQADDLVERRRLATEIAEINRRAMSATNDLYLLRFGEIPLFLLEGKWGEAIPLLEAMRTQPKSRLPLMDFVSLYAPITHARGDDDLARTLIDEALPEGPATPWGDTRFLASVQAIRFAATLALDTGDLPAAKSWLEAHDRWLAWAEAVLGQSEGQALWARYHQQSGDMGRADEHAQRALVHATAPRQPLALIAAHRLLGELDTDTGRFADAETHLDASLSLADACEAPYERALTLLAVAELRAATGEHDAARALLDEVRAICTPLGAKPALARADALAARLA